MFDRRVLVAALGAAALALLSGCGGAAAGAPSSNKAGGKLHISTSFYPLQYVTARITGDRAVVSSLTPPGAEPHDLELTPKDVAKISDADLVVYLGGFQPAVDDAVKTEAKHHAENVAPAAHLDRTVTEQGEGTGTDPHFWLDPQRLSAVATQIEQRLAQLDPAGATTYQTNLTSLTADLNTLDAEYRAGLAHCANQDLVTSHQAFGYLSERYGMTQVGISSLSPDAEPNPAVLARVADFVRKNDVRTIYYETLVSPAIANAVAGDTGARTAVLDPIEGITNKSQGRDYFEIMRANLKNLEEGQPCS
jgi:zinc transport system substrate-binding protein